MTEQEKIEKIKEIHDNTIVELKKLEADHREIVEFYIQKLRERKIKSLQEELQESFKQK